MSSSAARGRGWSSRAAAPIARATRRLGRHGPAAAWQTDCCATVEQKNGAAVRHTVGHRRYEGLEAAAALADVYRLSGDTTNRPFRILGVDVGRPRCRSGCLEDALAQHLEPGAAATRLA